MLNNNRELPSFSFIFYCICFEMDAEGETGESEVVQLRARVASLEREVSGLQKSMSELQSQFMRLVPLLAQVPMPPKIEEDENDSSHQDNSALESDDFNQKMDLAGQPKGITRFSHPPLCDFLVGTKMGDLKSFFLASPSFSSFVIKIPKQIRHKRTYK